MTIPLIHTINVYKMTDPQALQNARDLIIVEKQLAREQFHKLNHWESYGTANWIDDLDSMLDHVESKLKQFEE